MCVFLCERLSVPGLSDQGFQEKKKKKTPNCVHIKSVSVKKKASCKTLTTLVGKLGLIQRNVPLSLPVDPFLLGSLIRTDSAGVECKESRWTLTQRGHYSDMTTR